MPAEHAKEELQEAVGRYGDAAHDGRWVKAVVTYHDGEGMIQSVVIHAAAPATAGTAPAAAGGPRPSRQ